MEVESTVSHFWHSDGHHDKLGKR